VQLQLHMSSGCGKRRPWTRAVLLLSCIAFSVCRRLSVACYIAHLGST
jgi:hypothetical protein